MSVASLSFVSWVRRGAATAIQLPDGEGPAPRRVTLPVAVRFNDALDAGVQLGLFGPGEVLGFDRRAVIRRWPLPGTTEAPPNLFPLVEFDQADLPWRYTPAAANAAGRLRPWLCLITLAESEIAGVEPASRTRPFPVVTTRAGTPLPPPGQVWAWAHVQLSGTASAGPAALAEALEREPHRVISRLLSPRRLDAQTVYWAMLVPVFEVGRRAGLGLAVGASDDALAPAWAADGAPVALPIYDRWRFVTAAGGDFEELVRRLRPRPLPATVGARSMDVAQPGAGLPPAAATPLGLEGALKSPALPATAWTGPEREQFIARLATLVNTPADVREGGGPPVVAPPLYGSWPALQARLRPGQPPVWFQSLNHDPRHRVAAGLGTLVVQSNERSLLASAWAQVGQLREVNDRLRHAQLAREVSVRLHARLFAGADVDRVLAVTSPVHTRVAASPTTVGAVLGAAPIPAGLLGRTWHRVARPLGPLARRQARTRRPSGSLLARVNTGALRADPAPVFPAGVQTLRQLGARLLPPGADEGTLARLRRRATVLAWLAGAAGVVAIGLVSLGLVAVAAASGAVAIASGAGAAAATRRANDLELRLAVAGDRVTAERIERAPARPDFVATDPVLAPPAGVPPVAAGEDSPSAQAFRTAAARLARRRAVTPAAGPVLRSADLPALRETLRVGLDPRVTITAGVRARLRLGGSLVVAGSDPLEPVLAGPDFPQPMYEPLAALSPEWILPGLAEIAPDSVALALTNPAFVEAYMVGLNHEMARELLWQEYPASQRATYFRQFWGPTGRVEGTPKDIRPIHQWSSTAALGANGTLPAGGQPLVLVIRGEVFRRYPHTLVYAVRARSEAGQRVLGDEERAPILRGSLAPDVNFFGFTLSAEEARGEDGAPGWFFVLQEPASAPTFGLDVGLTAMATPPAKWSDLSWGHLVPPGGDPRTIAYIDLDAEHPRTDAPALQDARWHAEQGLGPTGARAADLAYITVQQPVRVAIHGADLLPAGGGA
jgi:hypothetical protein